MKKHRMDNGDYPYENGHMNGEWPFILKLMSQKDPLSIQSDIALLLFNYCEFVSISWKYVIYC